MLQLERRKLLTIAGAVVVVAAGFYGYQEAQLAPKERRLVVGAETPLAVTKSDHDTAQIVRALVHEKGPAGAAETVVEYFRQDRPRSVKEMYAIMNILGEALVEVSGPAGVAYCRDDFGGGCQHGATRRVLHDYDLPGLKKILRPCVESSRIQPHACSHGIGHNLFPWSGNELAPALAACEELGAASPDFSLKACFDGVFREHTFASLGESTDVFRPDDYRYPCGNVAPAYRSACWFSQPARILLGLQHEGRFAEDEVLTRIIALCASLPGSEQPDCFNGYFRAISSLTSGDLERTLSLCRKAGADHYDACIIWDVSRTFAQGETSLPFHLCERVSQQSSRACSVELWGWISKLYLFEDPQYATLCRRVPSETVAAECLKHPRTMPSAIDRG